jgi:hypothetical protein
MREVSLHSVTHPLLPGGIVDGGGWAGRRVQR